jgi:starvation-inducible DNA-binding protein
VKEPNFIGLHELFDKVAEELEKFTDEIAERVVQLGGVARGTLQTVSKNSRLPAYPLNLAFGKEHIAALSRNRKRPSVHSQFRRARVSRSPRCIP